MNESSELLFKTPFYTVGMSQHHSKNDNKWFCNRPLSPIVLLNKCTDLVYTPSKDILNLDLEYKESEDLDENDDDSTVDPDFVPDSESEPENDNDDSNAFIENVESFSSFLVENSKPNPDNILLQQSGSIINTRTTRNTLSSNKKNKNFCMYCDENVYNFARHLERNHSHELEVQKLLALPKKSKERKDVLTAIRKKGNYIESSEKGKPMRKNEVTNYLPCVHCFGFYSSKNLWKHRKQCKNNSNLTSAQVEAQNFLLRNLEVDIKLQETVFPRMRADVISMTAKKDYLICAFAARYIKIHREKHFINVASRKMRELAKLLNEVQKIKSEIKNLFDALRPENYDNLIAATKKVAKYDSEKEYYESPTYAINMGTTLKQCCDIAIMQILKRKCNFGTTSAAESEEELKSLIRLIEAHWKFDISTQAINDLNVKKWNKISIVPLASDLKLLKEYLVVQANDAVNCLNNDKNSEVSYIKLLETVFCRIILLNRKRPGELQRFLLHTYESSLANESMNTYEEFSEAVSEVEKFLMKNFKRIIIRGKRGRGVPVLFTKDVQEHLKLLLSVRTNVMKKSNLYLFGNPRSTEPICGHRVLKKYALASGAKNPNAITCTRLRKHLATLTQLFNLSESDMEQLASFMGHTLGVHRSSYRLPDDVFQTAKISKLLLLMEKGEAGQFKGKKLDEIDLNLEEDLLDAENENKEDDIQDDFEIPEITEYERSGTDEVLVEASTSKTSNEKNKKRTLTEASTSKANIEDKKKKTRVLVPWTDEQKKVTLCYFRKHIKNKKPPKRDECEKLKGNHPELLKNKDWLKIKVFVQNKYTNKY